MSQILRPAVGVCFFHVTKQLSIKYAQAISTEG